MTGDGLPSDPPLSASGSPPAAVSQTAFGRFRLGDRLANGRLGPRTRGEDLQTGSPVVIKRLEIRVGPERTRQIADDLGALAARLPDDPHVVPLLAGGLDAGQLTIVTPLVPGEGLDIALKAYGPAALVDAVPRLEQIAQLLDEAAATGIWHGAMSPRDIIVSASETHLTDLGVAQIMRSAQVPVEPRPPYGAPEGRVDTGDAPRADQFALAAIAFEWVFGEAIDGPADAAVEVPTLPGVDREALADAFTTALAPDPAMRFASCRDFVAALRRAARVAEAPGGGVVQSAEAREGEVTLGRLPFSDALLDSFESEGAAQVAAARAKPEPLTPPRPARAADATLSWPSVQPPDVSSPPRPSHGLLASVFAVGVLVGAIGGYWVADRRGASTQGGESPAEASTEPAAAAPLERREIVEEPIRPAPEPADRTDQALAERTSEPAKAGTARPVSATARLLVRSTPAGASVTVDGTPRGVTPLALQDVPIGSRTIRVERDGYRPEERRIVLSAERPSRSIDVELRRVPATGTTLGTSAAATGSLLIESRPPGARVTIDGQVAGVTPLTIASIAPGRHTVMIALPGWTPVTTTVDVKAGARARVAATLEGGRQDE